MGNQPFPSCCTAAPPIYFRHPGDSHVKPCDPVYVSPELNVRRVCLSCRSRPAFLVVIGTQLHDLTTSMTLTTDMASLSGAVVASLYETADPQQYDTGIRRWVGYSSACVPPNNSLYVRPLASISDTFFFFFFSTADGGGCRVDLSFSLRTHRLSSQRLPFVALHFPSLLSPDATSRS